MPSSTCSTSRGPQPPPAWSSKSLFDQSVFVVSSVVAVPREALRRVLDRGQPNGSCIQTVPGRGYRFAARVTRSGTDPSPEAGGNGEDRGAGAPPGSNLPTAARTRFRPWHKIAVLFVVLAVSGSLAAWIWDHRRSVSTDTRPRFSMVVLPFANLGADPGQEQLVDAITSDLTTELSRIGHGFVISRNTAFTFHNRSVETKQIGRELGVRYVVEGGVRRLGNRVRVDAQLVDAETDALLWAQQFDGDVGDLFALEDDITRRIGPTSGHFRNEPITAPRHSLDAAPIRSPAIEDPAQRRDLDR